jgi:hypothetical protein
MPKGIMFVPSGPSSPDREDAYNEWYSTVHIPEVCRLDGVTGASRYKLVSADPSQAPYVAIYELEADDLAGVFDKVAGAAMSGELNMSDVLGMDPPPVPVIYEIID